MAYSEMLEPITLVANADLSANADQYRFVKVVNASGEGRAAKAGVGEDAVGTLYMGDLAGRPCQIGVGKVIKVKLGANLTAGARIQSDANGDAIAVTGGGISLGVLLKSGSTGEISTMLWAPIGTA